MMSLLVYSCACAVLFFFFQAEDGIRDLIVTGVQTCALPILAVFLGALLVCAASGAGASSLERFAEFVAKTRAARGEFEQKIFDRNLKLLQESRGALAFSRPGKFRWNYVKPYAQLIVGDGSRVWIYDEDLKQVTVRKLDDALGSTPAALLAGNNEAMRAFRLSDKGAKDGLEWLEALPRE